jgi:hypothetical protein
LALENLEAISKLLATNSFSDECEMMLNQYQSVSAKGKDNKRSGGFSIAELMN